MKVMVLYWLNTSPNHRYKLFCDGKVNLYDVKDNPIVKAHATDSQAEIDVLKRVGYVDSGQVTDKTSFDEIWSQFVELDLSED